MKPHKKKAASSDLDVNDILQRITQTALTRVDGNRTEAAHLLGINLRTLRNWIRKWKLNDQFPARSVPFSRESKKDK